MTTFELLTLLVALLAVAISAASLVRTRAIAQEQLELQRTTSQLAKKQLELLLAEEAAASGARLEIHIEPSGNSYKFVVSNVGDVPAKNVSFQLRPHGKGESPLITSDFSTKFPVPILGPGSAVGALAALSFGSATAFDVTLTWQDPNGRTREAETFVAF